MFINFPAKIDYLRKSCFDGMVIMKAENDMRKCNLLHDKYDILLLLAGGNEMTYRKTKIQGKKGIVEVFEPGEVHTTEKTYSAGNYYVVCIDEKEMIRQANNFIDYNQTPHFKIQNIQVPILFNKFRTFVNAFQSNLPNIDIESKYIDFLRTLFEYSCEYKIEQMPLLKNKNLLFRVRDYLHEHFLEDVSLDQLIQICPMSKSHFIRSFKAFFGIPPHLYLKQVRINNLKMEIERLGKPTNIYCFTDQSHFIKSFKQLLGVTPTKYRKLFL